MPGDAPGKAMLPCSPRAPAKGRSRAGVNIWLRACVVVLFGGVSECVCVCVCVLVRMTLRKSARYREQPASTSLLVFLWCSGKKWCTLEGILAQQHAHREVAEESEGATQRGAVAVAGREIRVRTRSDVKRVRRVHRDSQELKSVTNTAQHTHTHTLAHTPLCKPPEPAPVSPKR